MQRRPLLTFLGLTLMAIGEAEAQTSLRPDPTPRLPPQRGQGLPIEDRRFLRDARMLSLAQAKAAEQAARQGGNEDTRRFAASLAERHRELARQMAMLAEQHGGVEAAGPQPDARISEALHRLDQSLGSAAESSDAGRRFLSTELEVHSVLVEMYQAQASQTTDRELARIAINALVGIQEDFATAMRLGALEGLAPKEPTVANPPQYGGPVPTR